MHFPSVSISKALGISLQTPFLDKKIIEYAKSIPTELKVHEENGKKYGKWVLRKTFDNMLPQSIVWRDKDAMQDGSGTNGLTHFFNSLVPDSIFSEKTRNYLKEEQIELLSKEALYYYEIYRRYYDYPARLGSSKNRCLYCNYSVEEGSHFCRMCGAFPI
jgi:asparagine synthase (glutamine-hydrolysing)